MTVSRLCRAAAGIVVIAAVLNPPLSLVSRALPHVGVLRDVSTADAEKAVASLRTALARSAVIESGLSATADAFVLITDRYPASPLPRSRPVHIVGLRPRSIEDPRIAGVSAPAIGVLAVPVAVIVELSRQGTSAARTNLRLTERGAVVATADVKWADGQRSQQASLTYVPTRAGPTRLRVATEETAADLLVDVRERMFQVRVAGDRPSWTIAFAASVLADDDRLSVSTRVSASRGRSVVTGVPLAPGLADEADVIIMGAIEGLDAHALRQAAAGGRVVILALDGPAPPAVGSIIGASRTRQHVSPEPILASNGLRASEWLLLEDLSPAARVRATVRIGGREYPAIVEAAVGAGHIVLVAALDAWRYRGDPLYGKGWRELVVELAARQVGAFARLRAIPAVARPGEELTVTYDPQEPPEGNVRRAQVVPDGARTGSTVTLVRIAGGRFVGRTTAPDAAGIHHVVLQRAPGAVPQTAVIAVAEDASIPDPSPEGALSALAASHGGTFVRSDEIAALATTLRTSLAPAVRRTTARPMRWPGWVAIVAMLLGVEWWTRRRNGLR